MLILLPEFDTMTFMRILGIDPGLHITGYGVLETGSALPRLVEAGVIRTTEGNSIAERLGEIAHGLEEIIREFQPDAMAIEELYSHYSHPNTAIIMGHARGVVLLRAAEAHLAVFPYASTRIKKSLLGNGRASKEQVQMMIRSTLGLKEIPEPPDAADALAAALCHCRAMEHNVETAGAT